MEFKDLDFTDGKIDHIQNSNDNVSLDDWLQKE